jgi:hypothetical protein
VPGFGVRRTFLLVGALAAIGCSKPSPAVTEADAVVPPRPAYAGGAVRGSVETFAIDAVFLGETDRAGTPSGIGWAGYGYDLDGLVTDATSTTACTLHVGAPRSNQTDGTAGRDNGFGSVLLPILQTSASDPAPSESDTVAIRGGAWTLEIELDGLSSEPNVVGIGAQVFAGGTFDGIPDFDGSTDWPILASSVNDGATIASGARVAFEDAYVTPDGTFVSGIPSDAPIDIPIVLPLAPEPLVSRVHRAVVTFRLDPRTQRGSPTGRSPASSTRTRWLKPSARKQTPFRRVCAVLRRTGSLTKSFRRKTSSATEPTRRACRATPSRSASASRRGAWQTRHVSSPTLPRRRHSARATPARTRTSMRARRTRASTRAWPTPLPTRPPNERRGGTRPARTVA